MSRTLLLADDSVTIQRVVELTFAHEDVRVVAVNDGARAVQWLDAETPDIVLVDVGVPEVDGYAVASHVKKSERLRHVPVLLLAGAFEPVDEGRARSIGCSGVIVKPFEPKQLAERVGELLAAQPAVAPGAAQREAASLPPLRPVPVAEARPAAPPGPPIFPPPAQPGAGPRPIAEPQPLELPARPMWDPGPSRGAPTPASDASGAQAKVALVNVFSALLAAERPAAPAPPPVVIPAPAPVLTEAAIEAAVRRVIEQQQQLQRPAPAPAAAQPPVAEAAIEAVVRRVLEQMTADAVQRIVYETAERLVKEEIEKIKSLPE
jgi:CheY-like chemotaxis protein